MKAVEVRKMNIAEMQQELLNVLREQFILRMQHGTKQLTQTSNLKVVRRKIALLKTILHEKIGQAS